MWPVSLGRRRTSNNQFDSSLGTLLKVIKLKHVAILFSRHVPSHFLMKEMVKALRSWLKVSIIFVLICHGNNSNPINHCEHTGRCFLDMCSVIGYRWFFYGFLSLLVVFSLECEMLTESKKSMNYVKILPLSKTELRRKSTCSKSISFWNSLDTQTRELSSTNCFKNKLKSILL